MQSLSSSIIQHGECQSTRKLGGGHPVKAFREISEVIHVCKQVMVYSFPKPKFHCQTPPLFFSKKSNSSCQSSRSYHQKQCFVFHPVPNDNGSLDLNLEILFFNDDMQELNILGACMNGVICLYDCPFLISNQHPNDDLYRIALWNPAIREFKVLPTRHVHCPSHVDYTYEGFGFVYDHKSNDYKVVRIV